MWPESQEFIGNSECIQSEGMSFFVPCELVDKNPENNEQTH